MALSMMKMKLYSYQSNQISSLMWRNRNVMLQEFSLARLCVRSKIFSTQKCYQSRKISKSTTSDNIIKYKHSASKNIINKSLSSSIPLVATFKDTNCQHFITGPSSEQYHTLKSKQPSLLSQKHAINKVKSRDVNILIKSIYQASPKSFQPYLRLIRFDKPIGTMLLFWPCSWSIGLAAQAGQLPDFYILTLFGIGAFLMRGAGCIVNDMWDKDFDKKVERTKTRPLASGELSSFQALVFLGSQLSLALAVLLQFNLYSVILGAASMGLVISYPLAKRYTYWPQVLLGVSLNWGVLLSWCAIFGELDWTVVPLYTACVLYTMFYDTIYSHQICKMSSAILFYSPSLLGLTFNYGVLLGWSAVNGSVDWLTTLPIYFGCLAWTLVYDTIYAHQDKYDDMLIGVKSTALKLGDQTKPWLVGFSTITITGITTSGYLCHQTWPFYLGVGAMATHLAHQIYTVDLNNPDSCAGKFRSNNGLGLMMFLGIMLGNLLKTENKEDDDGEEYKS